MVHLARLGIRAASAVLVLVSAHGCGPPPRLQSADAARPHDAAVDAAVARDAGRDVGRDAATYRRPLTRVQAIAALRPLCDAEVAWCGALSTCGCPGALACDTVYSDCMTDVQGCAAVFDAYALDIDARRLEHSIAERMRAAVACERYDDPWWCLDVVVERALVGEPCSIERACADGEAACVSGVCRAPDTAGSFCTSSRTCAEGLVCADHRCASPAITGAPCSALVPCVDGLACLAGTCAEPAATGVACGTSRDCRRGLACTLGTCGPSPAACARSEECAPGLVCMGAAATTCTADVVDGGACARASDCAPGRYCDAGGRCAAVPSLGAACESVCESGLSCDLGTHGCMVARDIGARCQVVSYELASCLPGQFCAGTCTAPRGLDASCAEGQCAAGLGCDWGQCAPLHDLAEACSGPDTCAGGLHCGPDPFTARCAPLGRDGDPCVRETDCEPGLYCAISSTSELVCRRWLAEGASCAHSYECASGTACRQAMASGTCVPDICAASGEPL